MLYAFYPQNCPRQECGGTIVYATLLSKAWEIMFEEFNDDNLSLTEFKKMWYILEQHENMIMCDGH